MERYQRTISMIFLGAALWASGVNVVKTQDRQPSAPQTRDQRVAAPEDLDCPRNDLTAFIGRVAGYKRNDKRLKIAIETDWQTKETRTLHYANEPALLKRLQIDGKAFAASDWSQIETAGNRLREGMRAKVWVCGQAPKQAIVRIDWEPPRKQ